MPHHSALRCVSGIRQNNAKPLISNGLRFIATCLPTAAWWVLFHLARHNFGTHITLSLGVPIETVARMMGHLRIETTQVYAKVTDKKVEEDMKKLKDSSVNRETFLYEEELEGKRRKRRQLAG